MGTFLSDWLFLKGVPITTNRAKYFGHECSEFYREKSFSYFESIFTSGFLNIKILHEMQKIAHCGKLFIFYLLISYTGSSVKNLPHLFLFVLFLLHLSSLEASSPSYPSLGKVLEKVFTPTFSILLFLSLTSLNFPSPDRNKEGFLISGSSLPILFIVEIK